MAKERRYFLREMQVGESQFFPVESDDMNTYSLRSKLVACNRQQSNNKIETAKVIVDGEEGILVKRVA